VDSLFNDPQHPRREQQVRDRLLLRHFRLKTDGLPRQARDKHRENSEKREGVFFSQIFESIKAQVQRDFAEALLQLAVYPPGKTALLADPSVAPVSGCAVCRRRRRRKASSCCCCHLDGFCSYPQATHWPCLALEPRQ
jgi:hypothetical protein